MPKLRNISTGVVVSVPAEKAASLPSDQWAPHDEPKPKKHKADTESADE